MGDRRLAASQCAIERNKADTRKRHGCTVCARGASRARGSLASQRAVREARNAVNARQLLKISSETGGGGGSSNDSSTRSAGTRGVVSAQYVAMIMLMSACRAGGPAHRSERGSSSLNTWAACERPSSKLKSSSPGHLPPSMKSCAGEDCQLPEKRAIVRCAGGAAVRRAERGASGLPAAAAALNALCAQGAGILRARPLPTWLGEAARRKVKLRNDDRAFQLPSLAGAVVTLKLYRTFGPKDSSYISEWKSRGRGGPWFANSDAKSTHLEKLEL